MKSIKFAIMAFSVIVSLMARGDSAKVAVSLLKGFEGFKATVYKCSAGKDTIGYGFTDSATVNKGYITKAEANKKLLAICKGIRSKVRKEIGSNLTEKQEAAIISFVYNVGFANFKTSSMCKLLKQKKSGAAISKEFKKWVYVTNGGKKVKVQGLINRRAKEAAYFVKG